MCVCYRRVGGKLSIIAVKSKSGRFGVIFEFTQFVFSIYIPKIRDTRDDRLYINDSDGGAWKLLRSFAGVDHSVSRYLSIPSGLPNSVPTMYKTITTHHYLWS